LPSTTTPTPTPSLDTQRRASQAPLRRFYMAVPFSDRGRPGPPSSVLEIPLTSLPDAPVNLRTTYSAEAVTLQWDPSGGLVGFLLDRSLLPPATPLDDGPSVQEPGLLPVGPTRYNVYREAPDTPIKPEPKESEAKEPEAKESEAKESEAKESEAKESQSKDSDQKGSEQKGSEPKESEPKDSTAPVPAVLPVNPTPLAGFSFTDPLQNGSGRRCYSVSAIRGGPERAIEGHPSMSICMTPVDIFPPAPPTGVSPIAVEGAISLVWEGNRERDLQGYYVWRGEEGSEKLTRITDQVVKETRYTDETVKPGVRYVYAVTAVDSQSPQPNVSRESERVEITAR
jgi:hypothetical protein